MPPGPPLFRRPWLGRYTHWNLPYPDLYYLGTTVVQISYTACSPLTIMKFRLDESTGEYKGCRLPVRCLLYSMNNNYHLVAGDKMDCLR